MIDIFNAEGDGGENDGTLFSLSLEFLEAARVLQEVPSTRIGFSLPTYYLLAHSAELMLKAFLHKREIAISDLKKIGHDLEILVDRAKGKGLPENVNFQQILQLADAYKCKNFEYRKHKRETFLSLDLLTKEIETLKSVIFDLIWKI